MLVRQVDVQVLSEVAQLVRKSTRKRMHFVTFLPMYRTDLTSSSLTLNLTVVKASNETQAINELIKQGFSQTKLLKKVTNQMLCEGEHTQLKIHDGENITLPVAYFNKHISSRTVTVSIPQNGVLKFSVHSASGKSSIVEGEAYA